jgi:hypothetical protein
MIAVYAVRSLAAALHIGGPVSLIEFNQIQAVMILSLVFLSMMWNFGFLLMTIDRLRAEVADLAMFDDLTGAANRRQFLGRLNEECARSGRGGEAFALLMIDLDDFQGDQRQPRPCRRRRMPAGVYPRGRKQVASRRSSGAHGRRRILCSAAFDNPARRRDGGAAYSGSLSG